MKDHATPVMPGMSCPQAWAHIIENNAIKGGMALYLGIAQQAEFALQALDTKSAASDPPIKADGIDFKQSRVSTQMPGRLGEPIALDPKHLSCRNYKSCFSVHCTSTGIAFLVSGGVRQQAACFAGGAYVHKHLQHTTA